MRSSTAVLSATICLALGIAASAPAAQPGGFGSQSPVSPGYQCDLSSSGDEDYTTQTAGSCGALASHYADAAQSSAPTDSTNVDVAPGLADQLNNSSGTAPEVISTPMGDAAISDQTLMDGSMCCPSSCCCPCWTVSVGAIFLNQTGTGHAPVLDRQVPGIAVVRLPVQNASAFDPGIRFGYEFDVIRHNVGGSAWDLEARYFGINRWSTSLPAIDVARPGAAIPFILPVRISSPGDSIVTTYQSLLQNVEFNGRKNVNPWLQLIAGVRYIAFDDYVNYAALPAVGASRFSSVNTRNNLIGPQAGANVFLWQGRRFGVQTFGKAGIYGNAASNNVTATQFNGATFGSSAKGGHTSFVGELGLTGTYRLTNHWGFRSTYEMLWLDGVARAPDQFAVSNPVLGTGSVASNSSLFYYGAFFGLEYYR